MPDADNSVPERRKGGERFARHYVVQYKSADDSKWSTSPVKDFSKSGARLVCEKDFKPGDIIVIRLGMPFFKAQVELKAKVMWKREPFKGSLSNLCEIGVMFMFLEPNVEFAIEQVSQAVSKHNVS
jgi:hypothetical protein